MTQKRVSVTRSDVAGSDTVWIGWVSERGEYRYKPVRSPELYALAGGLDRRTKDGRVQLGAIADWLEERGYTEASQVVRESLKKKIKKTP